MSPALFTGFFGDDLYHYAIINHGTTISATKDISLFNLFSFVDENPERRLELQSLSIIPWWTGVSFQWNFWRPLTELTHYIDYAFLTNHLYLMHLQSIIWFFALAFILDMFFRQSFSAPSTALIATGIFLLDGSHGMTVAWLCNRSAILAAFFCILTLLLNHAAEKKRALYLLSYITFALSLLSAEMGISTFAFLLAYSLCLDKRKMLHSLIALTPYFIILAGWWTIYKMAGFGVAGSNDFYIEPLKNPDIFATRLLNNIPVLAASQWLPLPVDLIDKSPLLKPAFIAAGIATFFILFLLYRHSPQPRLVLFFIISGILSMFPLASTPLQDRNIIFVSIAFAGLLAISLQILWQTIAATNGNHVLAKTLFILLVFLHFVISPLLLIPMSYTPNFFQGSALKRAATLDVKKEDRVIILGGPVMEMAYLAPSLFFLKKETPRTLLNLCGNQQRFTAETTDAHTLIISSNDGLISKPEQFVRNLAKEPFATGDNIKLDGTSITIDNANDRGQPTSITVRFDVDIKELKIVLWTSSGFKLLNPSLDLPYHFSNKSRL